MLCVAGNHAMAVMKRRQIFDQKQQSVPSVQALEKLSNPFIWCGLGGRPNKRTGAIKYLLTKHTLFARTNKWYLLR